MVTREMDILSENQTRVEKQTREDLKETREQIRAVITSISNLSEKDSQNMEKVFLQLNEIKEKQTDIQADMERRFTAANAAQDLNIQNLMDQAQASGKKSGMRAGVEAGAGVSTAISTIFYFIISILNSFK